MGQFDVWQILQDLAKTGQHRFFTTDEIKKELKKKGLNGQTIEKCHDCLCRLWAFGYLELESNGFGLLDRSKRFKLKEGHISNS